MGLDEFGVLVKFLVVLGLLTWSILEAPYIDLFGGLYDESTNVVRGPH